SYGEFVGVFNLGNDAVVVWFNGTSYEDWDPEYPVQFQIIIVRDGGITVSLGDVRYTELDGDGFTGIYLAPLGTEITAGYMLPPHTSWMINTALHIASSRSIDLEGGEAANFTMPWDTGLLPHYSPYALWADANDPSDTSIYNTPAVPVVVEVAAGGPVGGRLAPAPRHAQMLPQASALLAALAAAAALAAYRARRAG
ncbi:MAG: hypothetical protein QI199_00820, partial [Candidatus Korarchaeota archaeon]|nr:hypothetical protein [Candidatus Korarchaeota archaeon]